jgi:hypothetical protein
MIYTKNNINFQKCELYNDFIQSLLMVIFDTYMGDDVTDFEEQSNHFKWCWDKTIDNFKSEGLNFSSGKLFNYFLEFSIEVFYSNKEKNKIGVESSILGIWVDLFDYTRNKTNSEVDTLIEIYQLMENSLILDKN